MRWVATEWACLVVAVAACGGTTQNDGNTSSPRGSATVMGTIDGKPVPTNDAVASQLTTSSNGVTTTSRTISITSVTNACPCATTSGYSTVLALSVGVLGTSIAAGTYSFPTGANQDGGTQGAAEAHYLVNNPGTTLLSATSGSITISQIDASTTVGSFDVTFETGDHVTGTFTAPTCAAALSPDAGCP